MTELEIEEKQSRENTPEKVHRSPQHIFDDQLFTEWSAMPDDSSSDPSSFTDVIPSVIDTFSIEYENGIFSSKWSPDGQYLALGCADGGVRVLTKDGRLAYRIKVSGNMPITSMKWKTSLSGVGSSNTLATGSSNGSINFWHVQSQKSLYSILEENNAIFAFDYSPNCNLFASAGKDKTIRVYDDETKKIYCKLEQGFMAGHPGHSNRIFALKWKSDDENIIISGGWDNTVLLWDLRSNKCFRSIYGPHIAGETIDVQNDKILTGSWRIRDAVQVWEFRTGKLLKTIHWKPSPMIYAASFSPSLDGIAACGGTGRNSMRIININNGTKSEPIQLKNKSGIYSIAWEPKGEKLSITGHTNDVTIVQLSYSKSKRPSVIDNNNNNIKQEE